MVAVAILIVEVTEMIDVPAALAILLLMVLAGLSGWASRSE